MRRWLYSANHKDTGTGSFVFGLWSGLLGKSLSLVIRIIRIIRIIRMELNGSSGRHVDKDKVNINNIKKALYVLYITIITITILIVLIVVLIIHTYHQSYYQDLIIFLLKIEDPDNSNSEEISSDSEEYILTDSDEEEYIDSIIHSDSDEEYSSEDIHIHMRRQHLRQCIRQSILLDSLKSVNVNSIGVMDNGGMRRLDDGGECKLVVKSASASGKSKGIAKGIGIRYINAEDIYIVKNQCDFTKKYVNARYAQELSLYCVGYDFVNNKPIYDYVAFLADLNKDCLEEATRTLETSKRLLKLDIHLSQGYALNPIERSLTRHTLFSSLRNVDSIRYSFNALTTESGYVILGEGKDDRLKKMSWFGYFKCIRGIILNADIMSHILSKLEERDLIEVYKPYKRFELLGSTSIHDQTDEFHEHVIKRWRNPLKLNTKVKVLKSGSLADSRKSIQEYCGDKVLQYCIDEKLLAKTRKSAKSPGVSGGYCTNNYCTNNGSGGG